MTKPIEQHSDLIFPASVVGKLEVSRLIQEVEQIDNDLITFSVHERVGAQNHWQLVLSPQLEDLLSLNSVDINDSHQRRQLIVFLRILKDKAPVVHLTFATAVDRESLQKIADWLRSQVHPQVILSIGLQPNLVGGVYIRTENQVHDFSLRSKLDGQSHLIAKQVEALLNV